ncbi:hypothetical protein D3C79_719960 [compost metagenome]
MTLVEGIHLRDQLCPCLQSLGVFAQTDLRSLFGNPAQPWVKQRSLFIAERTGQPRRAGKPQGIERLQRVAEPRVDFLNLCAQPCQALHGLGHQCLDLRVDLHVTEVGTVGDAQAAQVLLLAQPRRLPGCAGQPVTGIGAGDAVEHQYRIVDGARHRPQVRQHGHGTGRPLRYVAEGRLDAEGAGKGARDANRAAGIAALVQHAQVQRGCRRGATGRAAGGQPGIPGVAGDAVQRVVGHPLPAELRRGGLAHQHSAGFAHEGREGRIDFPRAGARGGARALACRHAPGQGQVLDRGGYAVQPAAGLATLPALFAGAGGGAGTFAVDMAIGIDRRVVQVDARQHIVDHLDR